MEDKNIVQLLKQLNDNTTKIINRLDLFQNQFFGVDFPDSSVSQQQAEYLIEKYAEEARHLSHRGASQRKYSNNRSEITDAAVLVVHKEKSRASLVLKNRVSRYLLTMFTKPQLKILRQCLRLNLPVHFYGSGIGKSTLANNLREAGYTATEAGECQQPDALSVPDRENVVCLCLKKCQMETILWIPGPSDLKLWTLDA